MADNAHFKSVLHQDLQKQKLKQLGTLKVVNHETIRCGTGHDHSRYHVNEGYAYVFERVVALTPSVAEQLRIQK